MNDVLLCALEAAVPLWISELRGHTPAGRCGLAHAAADVVAEHGDHILYRGAKAGDSAQAFNALARGLACAAYQPGGVRFGQLAWCAAHPQQRWAPADKQCPACVNPACQADRAAMPATPGPGTTGPARDGGG
jgi:hypothetical protein